MVTVPRLTEAQRQALLWLTPGLVCANATRDIASALSSLALYHPNLVDSGWRKTPRGRRYLAYALTDLGASVHYEVKGQ